MGRDGPCAERKLIKSQYTRPPPLHQIMAARVTALQSHNKHCKAIKRIDY